MAVHTEAFKAKVVNYYKQHTAKEASKKFDVKASTLWYWAKQDPSYGGKMPNKSPAIPESAHSATNHVIPQVTVQKPSTAKKTSPLNNTPEKGMDIHKEALIKILEKEYSEKRKQLVKIRSRILMLTTHWDKTE